MNEPDQKRVHPNTAPLPFAEVGVLFGVAAHPTLCRRQHLSVLGSIGGSPWEVVGERGSECESGAAPQLRPVGRLWSLSGFTFGDLSPFI